ncbi:MAG: Ig-like domain-containing protein [Aggregatilineales bacterium]
MSRYRNARLRVAVLQPRSSTPANNIPTASNASYETPYETALNQDISGLASDSDVGDTLTFTIFTDGSDGTATVNSNGTSFVYTPDGSFTGSDDVVYQVSDGTDTDTGTITITVPVTAPVAANGSETTPQDDVLTDTVAGLVTNETGATLTYAVTVSPSNGTVSLNTSTGAYDYTPDDFWSGSDSFTYSATNSGGSDTGTVTITVTAFARSALASQALVFNDGNASDLYTDTGKLTNVTNSTDIAAYDDLSSSGNDETQGTAASRPTWTTAGGAHFTSSGNGATDVDYLRFDSVALTGGTTGYTIFIVALLDTGETPAFTSEGRGLYGNQSGTSNQNPHLQLQRNTTDNINEIQVSDRSDDHKYEYNATENVLSIYTVRTDGSQRDLWVDGLLIGSNTDSSGITTVTGTLDIGASRWYASNYYGWDGRIALFEVYNAPLTDKEVAQVINEIAGEY